VATSRKSASNNMVLTHRDGFAVDFECAPDETFELWPEDGLLVHANHWRSPVARSKLRETGLQSVPDSLYRDRRVEAALRRVAGRITLDDVRWALLDDWQSPWSVCMPPVAKSRSGSISATVATIMMVPALGEMQIAPLPSLGAQFTRYALTPPPETVAV
jgi:isopenicillin-N N-acyltransferase-like protein